MLKYLFYCMANKPLSASLLKLISYKKNTGSETLEVPNSICDENGKLYLYDLVRTKKETSSPSE